MQSFTNEDNKKKYITLAIVALVIIAVLSFKSCSNAPKGNKDADNPNYETVPTIHLIIDSKSFTSSCSPVIAHITGETTDEENVDFYHVICPNPPKDSSMTIDDLILKSGHYTLEFIPAITDNGSLLEITPTDLTVESVFIEHKDDEVKPIDIVLETNVIANNEVTSSRIEEVTTDTINAIKSKNIDKTITGDNGRSIIDNLIKNIENSDNIDADVIDKIKQQAEEIEITNEASIELESNQVNPVDKEPTDSKSKDKPKKKVWVVDKKAYDEQVKVKDAYTEKVCVCKAYDEEIIVKDGWSEQVKIRDPWSEKVKVKDAVYEDKVVRGYYLCSDGHKCYNEDQLEEYLAWHDVSYSAEREYEKVLVSPAKYETVHHDAEYETIWHEPQFKYVHHDAKYKTVKYPAQYKPIHHAEEGHWEYQ